MIAGLRQAKRCEPNFMAGLVSQASGTVCAPRGPIDNCRYSTDPTSNWPIEQQRPQSQRRFAVARVMAVAAAAEEAEQ
jgi:hypothetical protein